MSGVFQLVVTLYQPAVPGKRIFYISEFRISEGDTE